MNSFQFRFRPNLESMDERIVPDAAPIAAPVPNQPVNVGEPAPPPRRSPGDMTDDELRARAQEIMTRQQQLLGSLEAVTVSLAKARERLTEAAERLAAAKVGGDPLVTAMARAACDQAALHVSDLEEQQQAILNELDRLDNELTRINQERDRRLEPVPKQTLVQNAQTQS